MTTIRRCLLTIALSLPLACGRPTAPGPARLGEPSELEPADAVAAGDLDGDGNDSLVLVHGGMARWDGREQELGALVQVVARGDVDGDGREEILLGCGMGRGQRRAPARVWLLDEQGAMMVWEREGARNQITELLVTERGVWMAAFADGKQVEAGWLAAEDAVSWSFEPQLQASLATRQVPLEQGALVGRIYGDEPRSDGDLQLRVGDSSTVVPTLRGVRALLLAEIDGKEGRELLVGDGWHYKYGTNGVARVRLHSGPDFQQARTIASFDGEFTVRQLQVSASGPSSWLLATGSSQAHVLFRDGMGWQDLPAGVVGEAGNAVIATRDGQQGVLLSGQPATWRAVLR